MAEWKKIIVSGSQAELAGATGSFTGSFIGDGTGLTGVSSFSVSGDTNNRVITADGAGGGVGEPNLTFDGSTLLVNGTADANVATIGSAGDFTIEDDGSGNTTLKKGAGRTIRIGDTAAAGNSVEVTVSDLSNEVKLFAATSSISGSLVNVAASSGHTINLNAGTIAIPNVPAGEDNTVVVYNGTTLLTDEIDGRVWGTSLVDAANGADNRIATFTDANSLNGEANLTYDGSTLSVTGTINASSTITGSTAQLNSVPAGTDNTVLIVDNNGNVLRDEIDSRVWGSTLVDGSGLADGYITFASDSDTITGASDFTYTSGTKTLSVTNATITGNLIVQGTTTELQVTNLNIEDQFILLNSGSTGADTGIVFGGAAGAANEGAALYFDNNASRLTYIVEGIAASATTANHVAGGYVTVAYDVDTAGQTPVAAVGNIRIEGGEAFIYA
jgi:hypothetical protein